MSNAKCKILLLSTVKVPTHKKHNVLKDEDFFKKTFKSMGLSTERKKKCDTVFEIKKDTDEFIGCVVYNQYNHKLGVICKYPVCEKIVEDNKIKVLNFYYQVAVIKKAKGNDFTFDFNDSGKVKTSPWNYENLLALKKIKGEFRYNPDISILSQIDYPKTNRIKDRVNAYKNNFR